MLFGGVSCRSAHAQAVHDAVRQIQAASPFPQDSIQWKHFRPEKWATYKKLVDLFLDENDAHRLDFSCLVIDTRKLNHRRFNDGDGETFFQKVTYQAANGILRKYDHPDTLRMFHGKRSSRYDLWEVRGIINSGMARDAQFATYRPLKQLDYMTVQSSGLHQITDVLLGAVSYHWNAGLRQAGGRKKMLADYIRSESCAHDLGRPTPRSKPHFDIWEFRLKE